jgi:DNA repair protein RadC
LIIESIYTKEIETTASIHDPDDAYRLVVDLIKDSRQEKCFVITMDVSSNVLGIHLVNIGKNYTMMFSMQDIFYHAIMDNARKIIVFHNHPGSGICPSDNDIKSAQETYKAGTILDITVQDVMVVSEKGFSSIKPSVELITKGDIILHDL